MTTKKIVDLAERRNLRELRKFLQMAEDAAAQFRFYILDAQRNVIPAPSLDAYVAFKTGGEKLWRVGWTEVGDSAVSTSFLCVDMNHARLFNPNLPTVCFETLIFAPKKSYVVDRYSTWAEAEAGHAAVVRSLAA